MKGKYLNFQVRLLVLKVTQGDYFNGDLDKLSTENHLNLNGFQGNCKISMIKKLMINFNAQ